MPQVAVLLIDEKKKTLFLFQFGYVESIGWNSDTVNMKISGRSQGMVIREDEV